MLNIADVWIRNIWSDLLRMVYSVVRDISFSATFFTGSGWLLNGIIRYSNCAYGWCNLWYSIFFKLIVNLVSVQEFLFFICQVIITFLLFFLDDAIFGSRLRYGLLLLLRLNLFFISYLFILIKIIILFLIIVGVIIILTFFQFLMQFVLFHKILLFRCLRIQFLTFLWLLTNLFIRILARLFLAWIILNFCISNWLRNCK